MKFNRIIGAVAGMGALFLSLVMMSDRLYAATAAAIVEARVLLTISITTLRGLAFGAVSASATPGTVTVQPDGTLLAAGGAVVGNGGTVGAASFQLNGQPNVAFNITLPAAVLLTEPNGNSMTVSGFQSQPSGTGQLDGNGTLVLKVGGTLEVGVFQAPGSYTGLMDVAVNYN